VTGSERLRLGELGNPLGGGVGDPVYGKPAGIDIVGAVTYPEFGRLAPIATATSLILELLGLEVSPTLITVLALPPLLLRIEYGAVVPEATCPKIYGVIVTVNLPPLPVRVTAGKDASNGVVPPQGFTVLQPPSLEFGRSRPGVLAAWTTCGINNITSKEKQ
jgi:hypothetical protein